MNGHGASVKAKTLESERGTPKVIEETFGDLRLKTEIVDVGDGPLGGGVPVRL